MARMLSVRSKRVHCFTTMAVMVSVLIVSVLVCGMGFAATSSSLNVADPLFSMSETTPVASSGLSDGAVAMADIDGDTFAESITCYKDSGTGNWTVASVTNQGTVRILVSATSTAPLSGSDGVGGLCVADLDGDKKLDIVLGTLMDGVRWFSYTPSGVFAGPYTVCSPTSLGRGNPNIHDVAVGDVDNDGDVDVAATMGEYFVSGGTFTGTTWSNFSVFVNSGTPKTDSSWFQVTVGSTTNDPYANTIDFADLTGDNYLELVMAGMGVHWASNNGGRDHALQMKIFDIATNSASVPMVARAGELNNDQKKDIVCTWPDGSTGGSASMSNLLIIPNNGGSDDSKRFTFGSGNIHVANVADSALVASDIIVSDFDMNGFMDLGCAIPYTNGSSHKDQFLIYLNKGNTGFAATGNIVSGAITSSSSQGSMRSIAARLWNPQGAYDVFPDVTIGCNVPTYPSTAYNACLRLDNTTVEGFKPYVVSEKAITGRLVNVKFSRAVTSKTPASPELTNPLSYTFDPHDNAGQGTLVNNPTTVTVLDSSTVQLAWGTGAMDGGKQFSIDVATTGIVDAVHNVPLISPFSSPAISVYAPKVDKVTPQDARSILISFTVDLDANAANPANYTLQYTKPATATCTLNAHPDTVTPNPNGNNSKQYLLSWNACSMPNGYTMTVVVNAATTPADPAHPDTLVRSLDGIPFVEPMTGSGLGVSASPTVSVGHATDDSGPCQYVSSGPIRYYVTYEKPGFPDEQLTINLKAEDIILDNNKDVKVALTNPAQVGTITVDKDNLPNNTRVVTFSNITGDGPLRFLIQNDDTCDSAGNPVAPMSSKTFPVQVDNTPPELHLISSSPVSVYQYSKFNSLVDENGNLRVTATDTVPNGDDIYLNDFITCDHPTVDTSTTGLTTVTYYVSDYAKNQAPVVSLQVNVVAADSVLTIQAPSGDTPGGTTSPAAGVYGHKFADTVSISATPDRCHAFGGWTIDGSATPVMTNPYTLSMSASHTVLPIFTPTACRPGVKMIWPIGGEKWPMGKKVVVLWENYEYTAGSQSSLWLRDLSGSGSTSVASAADNADESQYEWTIPMIIQTTDSAKMEVTWKSDTTIKDSSANNFSIVDENDDSKQYATPVTVNGPSKMTDQFDYPDDEDWFYFCANEDYTYTIRTTDLGENCDTYLALYDAAGNLLASNDNVSGQDFSSEISDWTAPMSQDYFVQVIFSPSAPSTQFQRNFGPGTMFTLKVEIAKQGVSLNHPPSSISGHVLDAFTKEPIDNAMVILPRLGGLTKFTTEDGAFTITEVVPMRHTIVALAKGYQPSAIETLLIHGDAAEINFLLVPKEGFTGEEDEGENETPPAVLSVTTNAGEGGSVSPNGSTFVNEGEVFTVDIEPDACHDLEDVLVDGVSVGPVYQYVFHSVSAHHTLEASFVAVEGRNPSAPGAVWPSQGFYSNQVRVMWPEVWNAAQYQVYRSATADFAEAVSISPWIEESWFDDATVWEQMGGGGAVSDKLAQDSPHFFYAVMARNECGDSAMSVSAEGWARATGGVLPTDPPAPPANVSASDGSFPDRVRITWEASENVVEYQVYRSLKGDFSDLEEVGPGTTELWMDDFELDAGSAGQGCFGATKAVVFTYRVVARNVFGESNPSNQDTGYAGGGKALFEKALPAAMEDGVRLVAPAAPVAVRLRAEAPLAPDSFWVRAVCGDAVTETGTIEFVSPFDAWVICQPEAGWIDGATIEVTAGAVTVAGDEVTASAQFVAGVPRAKALETPPLDAPDSEAVPAMVADLGDGVFAIGPEEPFSGTRMAWLPLPKGLSGQDVVLEYLLDDGETVSWTPGASLEGWLDASTPVSVVEKNGTGWIGFSVRHGGVARLSVPVVSAQASLLPAPGFETEMLFVMGLLAVCFASARRLRRGVSRG